MIRLLLVVTALASAARADEPAHNTDLLWRFPSAPSGGQIVYLDRLPPANQEVGERSLHVEAGLRVLRDARLRNDYYDFHYPRDLGLATFALGAETLPWRANAGRFGIAGALGYATYGDSTSHLRLHLADLSGSAVYRAEPLTLAGITPGLGAGLGYQSYFQSGDVDGSTARGGQLQGRASAGVRFALSTLAGDPVFGASALTVDFRILRSPWLAAGSLDLAGNELVAGFSSAL